MLDSFHCTKEDIVRIAASHPIDAIWMNFNDIDVRRKAHGAEEAVELHAEDVRARVVAAHNNMCVL